MTNLEQILLSFQEQLSLIQLINVSLDFRVFELIDSNNSCWNSGLIEKLFLPCEVDSIKSIPLSMRMPADKLIWAETNNGLFTVKSAYKVAVDILAASPLGSSGSSSDKSNMTRFLKCVWKLDVPHKVRHFVWRACRDKLPTKRNLRHRQVLAEDMCDECKLDSETTGRVLVLS